MMIEALTTAPTATAITVDQAKAHCREEGDDSTTLITSLIDAATAYVEEHTGKRLITQTWTVAARGVHGGAVWKLPQAPVQGVTGIAYVDRDGANQTADLADFHFVADEDRAWLEPKSGKQWPALANQPNAITLTYVVGFGDAGTDVPGNLRQAMLMLIAHWFEHRESVVIGGSPVEVPMGVGVLIDQSRIGWFGA